MLPRILQADERTKKIPDGAGGLVESKVKFPIWLILLAVVKLRCASAQEAYRILDQWIRIIRQLPTDLDPHYRWRVY